jgi:group II intron reverse transcriptase/maturase
VVTTLAHLIDVEFLEEAYRRTRKDAAAGVDGVTAAEYSLNLDANLADLHKRLRSGRYYAPPVKRQWLDKDDGKKRPIGIPAFEDKVVQRAVAMLLGAIYEQEFKGFSHGFREGHSAHQALRELRGLCLGLHINWIVDADVSAFFDSIEKDLLRGIIKKRVNDGRIISLIGKWLNAGVLEDESLSYPERGTPQGGVISPLLANIYLHEVLDEWFVRDVKPRMKGRVFLIRFADDFVIGCEQEADARTIMAVLPKRFARYRLTIHPEKTKLVQFGKPSREAAGSGKGTFDFLGFTHYWARTRRGAWVIKRATARKRLRRAIKRVWQWCRAHRHDPVLEQYQTLSAKLRGHYQYYGVPCNSRRMGEYLSQLQRAWRYWLNRRGQKHAWSWKEFHTFLAALPLPKPKIVHEI